METPLIQAVRCRNFKLVERLLERGADVNKPNQRGLTALMMACIKDCSDIVSLLLTLPAVEIACESNHGLSALDYAVIYGHFHLCKLLYSLPVTQLKAPYFYYLIARKHAIRYVNYDVLLMHLEKGLED